MIQLRILCLSLLLIPLLGSFEIGPFFEIKDAGTAKEFLSLISILTMFLAGTLSCRVPVNNRSHNIFLYLFIVFIPISIYSAPPLKLMYEHNNMAGLWMWEASFWILAYFMLYRSIIAMPIWPDESAKKMIGKSIGWAAMLSAGYAYLQAVGLDQWQYVKAYEHIGSPLAANITAVMGNPTHLGIWLVICLPFVIVYFKKRGIGLVIGAIILTKSDFALAGVVIIPLLLAALRAKYKRALVCLAIAVILTIVSVWASWGQIRPKLSDNGRFGVWEQTIKDWKGKCLAIPVTPQMTRAQRIEVENINKKTYVFTGRGPGSFPYIYGTRHGARWESPHNIYLLSLYTIGLIGTILLLLSAGWIFVKQFFLACSDPYYAALYCSAAFICFAAIGTPFLNSGVLLYYSMAIFSLLSAKK